MIFSASMMSHFRCEEIPNPGQDGCTAIRESGGCSDSVVLGHGQSAKGPSEMNSQHMTVAPPRQQGSSRGDLAPGMIQSRRLTSVQCESRRVNFQPKLQLPTLWPLGIHAPSPGALPTPPDELLSIDLSLAQPSIQGVLRSSYSSDEASKQNFDSLDISTALSSHTSPQSFPYQNPSHNTPIQTPDISTSTSSPGYLNKMVELEAIEMSALTATVADLAGA